MATSATNTYTGTELIPAYPKPEPIELPVKLVASTTNPAGQLLGETATPGTFGIYVGGSATDPAKCILKYPCVTDASGNITMGAASGGGSVGQTYKQAPAYFGGSFKTTEITGLDAGAVVDLAAHFLHGVLADGVIAF